MQKFNLSQATLKKALDDFNFYIVCHPDNLAELSKLMPKPTLWAPSIYSSLYDIEIYVDPHVPKYARKWEFPATPFVEYEESDQKWAIPIGFGRWIDTEDLAFYKVSKYHTYHHIPVFSIPKGIIKIA